VEQAYGNLKPTKCIAQEGIWSNDTQYNTFRAKITPLRKKLNLLKVG